MTEHEAPIETMTCDQVREIDRIAIHELEMPGLVLMENAGRGVADLIALAAAPDATSVLIACGHGNNGGDGFVIARHLDNRGFNVEVVLCCEPAKIEGDARANLDWLSATNVMIQEFEKWAPSKTAPHWVVDALLGTGVRGAPRHPIPACVAILNQLEAQRVAVDIPTGLNGDSGALAETVFRADHTATFVAAKPGLLAANARPFVGKLHVVDIGVPRRIVDRRK